jgi:hypothetical protein
LAARAKAKDTQIEAAAASRKGKKQAKVKPPPSKDPKYRYLGTEPSVAHIHIQLDVNAEIQLKKDFEEPVPGRGRTLVGEDGPDTFGEELARLFIRYKRLLINPVDQKYVFLTGPSMQ